MPTSELSISKSFRWEMGHRLPYHQQGCQNLHGHSYELIVELFGTRREDGMILDYNDLKAAVKSIIDQWDHSFLVDDKDESVLQFLKSHQMKHIIFKGYSTAENISYYLAEVLTHLLSKNKNLTKIKIVVKETISSEAIAIRMF